MCVLGVGWGVGWGGGTGDAVWVRLGVRLSLSNQDQVIAHLIPHAKFIEFLLYILGSGTFWKTQ